MAKYTYETIAGLGTNVLAAQTTINSNFAAVMTAMEKTLSRDGTTPNQMEADLDMNSNQILNLPLPVDDTEPVRKGEFDALDAEFDALEITVNDTLTTVTNALNTLSNAANTAVNASVAALAAQAAAEAAQAGAEAAEAAAVGAIAAAIGVTVQAWDDDLDDIAALTPTDGGFMVGDGTDWTVETGATARASLGVYSTTEVDALITAEDLDVDADSGGPIAIDLDSATLTLTGGTGVDTSASGTEITFAIDATVATLSGSQTLTNKGIDFTDNTVTMTAAELETAVSDDNPLFDGDLGGSVQEQGDVLDDLNTLGQASADGEFLVATGAGTFAWESGATVRTSLGLGAGDTPSFTAITVGGLANTGATYLSGVISPSQITADQDDYAPSGILSATVVRVDSDADWSITGIDASQTEGRLLVIQNDGSSTLTLPHNDTGNSTAANCFDLQDDTDFVLKSGAAVILMYDATANRWRLIGGGGGAGVTIAESAPTSPTPQDGNLWVCSGSLAPFHIFVYYDDGDSQQWVDLTAAMSGQGRKPGEFFWHCGTTPPPYALECDGSAVSRTTYAPLFAEIGTTFGVGDGSTTFNLPDLTDGNRFIRAADGTTLDVGDVQADGAPDIDGNLGAAVAIVGGGTATGAFSGNSATSGLWASGAYQSRIGVLFAASADDPTYSDSVNEIRPNNIALLPCIVY